MALPLCSPPQDFLAVYLFNNFKVSSVLRIAATISFCGSMFRFVMLANDEFWPVVVGTFMMASVCSIFLNAQIIIANRWFSDKERAIAMSVLNVSQPIG